MLGRKESNTHSGKKGWVVVIHTASLTSPPFFWGGGGGNAHSCRIRVCQMIQLFMDGEVRQYTQC